MTICSYHIYIYDVTYVLCSSLLRQYIHCSQKCDVQFKMSCSFSAVDSVCGPTPYAPNELHVILLKSCRKDLTDYLTNLGVSGSRGFGTRINEADVILNRAGIHSLSEEDKEMITVCPKHRYELTTHYQKLKSSCSYPSHRGEAKKLKNPRRVNKQVSEEINQEFKVQFQWDPVSPISQHLNYFLAIHRFLVVNLFFISYLKIFLPCVQFLISSEISANLKGALFCYNATFHSIEIQCFAYF